MHIKLAERVTTPKLVDIVVRPNLYADKCDGCGKVFRIDEYCNDKDLARLSGTFKQCAKDADNRGMGNGFSAHVCSFKCAHEVFENGGWRKMGQYKPFADADIRLVRAELKITVYRKDEAEIRREWEALDKTKR